MDETGLGPAYRRRASRHPLFGAVVHLLMIAALLVAFVPPTASARLPDPAQESPTSFEFDPAPDRARVATALSKTATLFIENVGQFDPQARFQVWDAGGSMWLAEDGLWLTVMEPAPAPERRVGFQERHYGPGPHEESEQPRHGVHLKLSFPGSNPHPRLEPFDHFDILIPYSLFNDTAFVRIPVLQQGRGRLQTGGSSGTWPCDIRKHGAYHEAVG